MDPTCITLNGYKIWFCTNLDRYKLSSAVDVVVAVVFRTSEWGGEGRGAVCFSFLSILQRILLERNYVSSSMQIWDQLSCHCSVVT